MKESGYIPRKNFAGDGYDQPKFVVFAPVYLAEKDDIVCAQISQKSIIRDIDAASYSKQYRDITRALFEISRKGEGLDTVYSLIPARPTDEELQSAQAAWDDVKSTFDIRRLLDGGDPFKEGDEAPAE